MGTNEWHYPAPGNCRHNRGEAEGSKTFRLKRDHPAGVPGEAIVRKAIQLLNDQPHFRGRTEAIQIHYNPSDASLRLDGRLPSYFLKQVLQSVLRDIDGVSRVQNNITITDPGDLKPNARAGGSTEDSE